MYVCWGSLGVARGSLRFAWVSLGLAGARSGSLRFARVLALASFRWLWLWLTLACSGSGWFWLALIVSGRLCLALAGSSFGCLFLALADLRSGWLWLALLLQDQQQSMNRRKYQILFCTRLAKVYGRIHIMAYVCQCRPAHVWRRFSSRKRDSSASA